MARSWNALFGRSDADVVEKDGEGRMSNGKHIKHQPLCQTGMTCRALTNLPLERREQGVGTHGKPCYLARVRSGYVSKLNHLCDRRL